MSTWPEQPRFLRLVFSTIHGTTKSVEVVFERRTGVWEQGIWFDGSSVLGLATVNASDLRLRPVFPEPIVQPWDKRVAFTICEVCEIDGEPHPRDARTVLRRVSSIAQKKGFTLYVGSELEFFLVTRTAQNGVSPLDIGGYLSAPPQDKGLLFRRSAIETLHEIGIPIMSHHHEVGNGQHEIGIKHATVPEAADRVLLSRLTISELAMMRDIIATFMPKPFAGLPGSGMHLHQSLWDADKHENLFASEKDGKLSDIAHQYIAGVLEHAPALTAVVAPTINSFKRLKPGFEAPTRIAWGPRNRTAMVRVPQFINKATARIEVRCPDPLCSPYLAMAAILAAGLDGIERGMEPPEAVTHDLFEGEETCEALPRNYLDAIIALDKDKTLRSALGNNLVDVLVKSGKKLWDEYIAKTESKTDEISSWEQEKYLLAV